jgi:acetyl-CoA acetyltransferase family protein
MATTDVYLISGARTPYCKAGTALRTVGAYDLAAHAFKAALARAGVAPELVDEVILGNIAGPAEATNVARVAALIAGLPLKTPGLTVNRNCGSGLSAGHEGFLRIVSGEAEIVLAGGAESMSQVPLLFNRRAKGKFEKLFGAKSLGQRLGVMAGFRPADFKPEIGLLLGLTDFACGKNMGETAETLAKEWNISRDQQDAFAMRSHQRAAKAAADGIFKAEIEGMPSPDRAQWLDADIGPRPDSSMEKLAKLRPFFDKRFGTITAGNSSQITDGGAAYILASEAAVKKHNLKPLARVMGFLSAGCDPARMGLGPAYAMPRLAVKLGKKLGDFGRLEINEAFAAQCLAVDAALQSAPFCKKELELDNPFGAVDWDKANIHGGAIALGHPVGSSGARLLITLAQEMQRSKTQYGMASLCIGGGQGVAAALERC